MNAKNFYLIVIVIISIIGTAILPFLGPFTNHYVIFKLNIPRVLIGFFIGASLSINGVVFQSLFRNDLATPYTLGVASGAAFGAVLFFQFVSNFIYQPIMAFLGALFATFLVYTLGMYAGGSQATLLLSGIAINFVFSSLILLIQYLGNLSLSFEIIRWMMGNLEVIGYEKLYLVIPVSIITFIIIFYLYRELDLFLFGDEFAKSKGVNVPKVRFVLFILVSISTGILVSISGPIGFVGMMIPHIVRLIVGGTHKRLILGSFFLGGFFLSISDFIGKILISPTEIPVGVITALLGGPFFLWLLLHNAPKR